MSGPWVLCGSRSHCCGGGRHVKQPRLANWRAPPLGVWVSPHTVTPVELLDDFITDQQKNYPEDPRPHCWPTELRANKMAVVSNHQAAIGQ